MKISQMLQREDFYAINQKTLAKYYMGQSGQTSLYVYPKLNAIVTKAPAKSVRAYLLNEYTIRGNFLKKLLVYGYVQLCLASRGLLAAHKITVEAKVSRDTLIYPCNKKFRIFDFEKNTVDVITKDGFDDRDLVHEKEFRTKENIPTFVPEVLSVSGQGYKEKIIDGMPLARIDSEFENYRDAAFRLLGEYGKSYAKTVSNTEYINGLLLKIQAETSDKVRNKEVLAGLCKALASMTENSEIPLGFSHGDFQSGNIWIENKTNKIYIIDWESWDFRSVWYDEAVLYHGLRPQGISHYLQADVPNTVKAVVLLEDLVFQLNELNSLPEDFGEDRFGEYVTTLIQWDALPGKE